MNNISDTPTSLQLHEMLEDMARKDLLGPAIGPEEIIAEPQYLPDVLFSNPSFGRRSQR